MPFVLGLVAQAGATVMYVVGSHPATLVIARFLQGVSASGIWVVGLALIVDTVGKEHTGESMGYTGMAMTWGLLLGPMTGGIMCVTLTAQLPISLGT
jgi:MFS family permease